MTQSKGKTQSSSRELPTVSVSAEENNARSSYGSLRFRDFRLLLAGIFLSMFSRQMITVAIGWELYKRTGSALVLGGVGLAQIIPVIALFLPAGYASDRYSRKYVLIASQVVFALAALGLAVLSIGQGALLLIYSCLTAMGCSQAFSGPASSAIVSQVVPESAFENASTWRSSIAQSSAVLGPATGGFLIGIFHGAAIVYMASGGAGVVFILLLLLMQTGSQPGQSRRSAGQHRTPGALLEGVRFLGKTQVMLAAITLDLLAVLLGGSVTLLPIYAQSILHVGPIGLGWLQAADSMGAICMAFVLAHRPPFRKAGPTLLLAVSAFGVVTIIFGVSQWFWLSFLMLFLLGAADSISVIIRTTLLLVRTPDEMRGRVSAISSLFIGTSNQLGGFESGLVAQLIGPILAVVTGGIGTLLVVVIVTWLWPEMRRLSTLRENGERVV